MLQIARFLSRGPAVSGPARPHRLRFVSRLLLLVLSHLVTLAAAHAKQPMVQSAVVYASDTATIGMDILSQNASTLQVTLRRADSSVASAQTVNVVAVTPASQPVLTHVTMTPVDSTMVKGDIVAYAPDTSGTSAPASAPLLFTAPVYKSAHPVTVNSLVVTRPRTFTIQALFGGLDVDNRPVTFTVRFLDTNLQSAAPPVVIQYTPDGSSTGFLGNGCVDAAHAAFVTVQAQDNLGNLSTAAAVVPPAYVPGDADFNGSVSIADAVCAWRMSLGTDAKDTGLIQRSDVSPYPYNDGQLGLLDLQTILRIAGGAVKGYPKG